MNNKPKPARPVFHARNLNQPHPRHAHGPSTRQPMNFSHPKPPSYSRAPWDVTQWIDPIEARQRNRRR
ncbi:unnamed protein product [Rotaria sp. Silwood2]|nr:unnamed protein product [Rotaria sp. Silwood2]CAF2943430.1 unnamed protein product [Rotaria sp. Silwood2]CAF3169431.1 unnamed protein product [Rotaria sp. Silwood2]CAF4071240.1 unnamed protein product [Rotaria sp. Silwood2]CAF4360072.1 unnamed protein product [Rotaria sp. Silwood2]